MFKDIFDKISQEKGLSTFKIAKDTCIPKSTLYNWASGEREPVSKYLVILADYLDCSVDYLLGRTDNPKVHK